MSGRITVDGRHMRETILRLRDDPALSMKMAAEVMRRQQAASLLSHGRAATATDLYLLHVLGVAGSARFLLAEARRPAAPSVEVVARRLLRNAGLLASDGRPMTVAKTYAAIGVMLKAHRVRAQVARADHVTPVNNETPRLLEVAQAVPSAEGWCNLSDLVVCSPTTWSALQLPPT